MRKYLLPVLLILGFPSFAQKTLERELREEILNHDFDGPQIVHFYEISHSQENPGAVVKGYQAVSEAFMARVEWNPYSKIVRLKKSEEIFEEALSEDPDNLEIRFLRFSTQAGIPSFLGFSKDMEADKNLIIENIDSITAHEVDENLLNFIIDFLWDSKYCTAADIEILKKKKRKA